MLNCGPGNAKHDVDVSKAPFHALQDIRLAGTLSSNGGGATPMNSNAASWNMDMVTTTGKLGSPMPRAGQSIHMMTWPGVLRELWDMRRKEGRNVAELALYTTDDLRRLYQIEPDDMIRLRDGIVSRVQLVAVIRWRIAWARFGYGLLLAVSVASACFALLAWRDPVAPPPSIPAQNSTLPGR